MRHLTFLIIICSGFAHAQNRTIDSLLTIVKTGKQDTNRINTLNLLSQRVGWRVGNYDTALYYAENAKKMAEKLKFQSGIAASNSNIGIVNYFKGNYPQALSNCNIALKLFEETGNKRAYSTVCSYIGIIYEAQGNYQEALNFQSMYLKVQQEFGNKSGIAAAYFNIGNIYAKKGDYDKALETISKALKINEEIGNKGAIANNYNTIGNININLGNYSEALKNYTASLKIAEETGSKKSSADCYNNIGIVYELKGQYPEALKNYTISSGLYNEIGDKYGIANSYLNIGNLCNYQGNHQVAHDNYLVSQKLFEEMGDKHGVYQTYLNVGSIYKDQGNYTEALANYLTALKICEELGNEQGIALIYGNLGNLYINQLNYTKALEYLRLSLKTEEKIGSKHGASSDYNNIAIVYLNSKPDSAIVYGHKSMDIALEVAAPDLIKSTSQTLFKAYVLNKQTDSALVYLSLLKNTISQQLDINYFALSEREKELYFTTMENDLGLYYDFASYYHNKFPGLADTVYNIALANKGLTLKSSTAMRSSIMNSGDTTLILRYEEWLNLKKEITRSYEAGKDMKETEVKATALERDLVKRSSVFNDFDKVKSLNWNQVQKELKKGEAAIEFVHYTSVIDPSHPVKYVALVIKPGSIHPEIIGLCNEADLQKILGVFQGNNSNFVNKVYGTKKEVQLALYKNIWEPLEKTLKGINTIYYSPTGLLHKISFASISEKKNAFLCDKYNLNRQSSTGKIAFPENANYSETDEVMIVGGVKYNTDSTHKEIWSYLPGTLIEADQIKKVLESKKMGTDYFVGTNAREENVKKTVSHVRILHIATHGFFFPDPEQVREEQKAKTVKEGALTFRGTTNYADWSFVNNKNPLMRSGLVLASANDVWERDPLAEGEDGILTAQEVANLNMQNTKLVVLSACETGLGDIKGSEGVYGLQRAFKMAGVKNIIMSLWQVPDKETSEFMVSFYQKLIAEKEIKKAFHTAQKEMRKKYDPYYWAAFVLVE